MENDRDYYFGIKNKHIHCVIQYVILNIQLFLCIVDFPSLLLSPSTYFKIFYFRQKYHLNLDCFNGPRLAAVGPSGGFVLMATIGQGYAMKHRLWLAIQSVAK